MNENAHNSYLHAALTSKEKKKEKRNTKNYKKQILQLSKIF